MVSTKVHSRELSIIATLVLPETFVLESSDSAEGDDVAISIRELIIRGEVEGEHKEGDTGDEKIGGMGALVDV